MLHIFCIKLKPHPIIICFPDCLVLVCWDFFCLTGLVRLFVFPDLFCLFVCFIFLQRKETEKNFKMKKKNILLHDQ